MAPRTPATPGSATGRPSGRVVFYGLVVLLLTIGVGHLYLLEGLTAIYLGLPLWVWVQLPVVFAMVGIAWIAVRLVAAGTGGGG